MSTKITLLEAIDKMDCKNNNAIITHLIAANKGIEPDWKTLDKLFLYDFVDHMKKNVSPNSARTYCAEFKSLLNRYNKAVTIPCDEYNKILSIRKVGTLNTYLTDKEIRLLIDYKPANLTEHTVRNQFILSCLTGMRHSDVIKLDYRNQVNNTIIYLSQKTQSLVHAYTCEVIEQYLNEGLDKIFSDVTFNDTIRTICKKVGINSQVKVVKAGKELTGEKYKFITSHTARRSFATNLYLATKDIYIVSKLMGHSKIETTLTYICCGVSENKSVIDYFSQYNNINAVEND